MLSSRRPGAPNRLLAALGLCVALLAGCGGAASGELRGIRSDPLPDVTGPTLPDAAAGGADFAFIADEGEVLLVYFGYTSCPDICPTTLADARRAIGDLDADDAGRVALAMVTIDPERDTGDILTGYVRSFVDDAHALVTLDDERLLAAADVFGASYGTNLVDHATGETQIFHTGYLYAVDDRGRLQVSWDFGTPSEDMTHDLALLLDAT